MEALQVFNYNDSAITFKDENGIAFVNATEMAKGFNKLPAGWLRTQNSKDFISQLSAMRNCIATDLVKVVNGGTEFGTWMHEDVALEFSRWLSPAFAIWCNDRIKELIKHGATAVNPEMLLDPDYVINVMTALKEERKKKELLEISLSKKNEIIAVKDKTITTQDEIIALKESTIKTISPKAEYCDKVLASTETYATSRIANELGISAITLNKKLAEKKVIRKVDGQWILYQQHLGKGYTKPHTVTFTKSDGTTGTNTTTVWTETGRKFIHEILNPSNA